MKIEFNTIPLTVSPHFQGGNKDFAAHIYQDEQVKILHGCLVPGASIGRHTHQTNSEIIYILSGSGTMLFDETEEYLPAGSCHYCPKGHSHSLQNRGEEDLIFFAVVPEQ